MGGVSSFWKGVSLSHRRDNITVLPRFELLYPFPSHGMLMLTLNLLLGMDDKVGWGTLTNVTENKLHTGNVETSKL